MRTKKIAWNVLTGIILHIENAIAALVIRKLFMQYIGEDILGINSVYSNILSFLTMSELGLGTTVAVYLYKPLAERDYMSINAYMGLLKKAYRVIGIVILGMGMVIMPAVPYVITTDQRNEYIYISFFIYLCSVAFSYLFSYKRILLEADQKAYIYQVLLIVSKLVSYIGFAAVIMMFQNYYLYLLVALICTWGENLAITLAVNQQYKVIKQAGRTLSREEYRGIVNKLKAMLLHKVGAVMVTGADNIIISAFIGTRYVTYYANYYLIICTMDAIFSNFAANVVASIGNLIYTSKEQFANAWNRIVIVQHFLFSISTSGFIVLATEFVEGYFGDRSVLDVKIVTCMGIVYYINGFSNALEAVRKAFGLFEQDQFFKLFSPMLNIIISIYGAQRWGIMGVLLGTIVCWTINKIIVLTYVLKKHVSDFSASVYLIQLLASIAFTGILTLAAREICGFIKLSWWFPEIILKGIAVVGIGIVINALLLGWRKEFRELINSVFLVIKSK